VSFRGKGVATSIFKEPVTGRTLIAGINVEGDDQADRQVHGGVDKAVYAYAEEDYAWWGQELDRELAPGTFGDNITTSGIDVSGSVIGQRWRVGSSLLEVAQPRIPCFKLGIRMGTQTFPRRFSQARRPGAYLRIVEAGDAAAGDKIETISRPGHGLTVQDVAHIYYAEPERAGELLEVPELPESWIGWARHRLGKRA
jgi:MOSC domain-containing protein YiiM